MNARKFEAEQRVLEIGERYLCYVDQGDGPPLVLLHGIPTWGCLWQDVGERLARRGHRVLIPDLLGFGYSDKSDRFDRSIERQAEMLDAWLGHLGIENATVAGHDIGGGVALRLAAYFPSRVSRLCLVDSVCYDSWPIETLARFGLPEMRRKISAEEAYEKLHQALERGFAQPPRDGVIEQLLAPYRTEVGKLSLIRDAVALDTNQTMELTPLLPQLGLPVLVLWGEEDRFQPLRYGERLAWDLPEAKMVRVPEAGHFVMLERPEETELRMASWVEESP